MADNLIQSLLANSHLLLFFQFIIHIESVKELVINNNFAYHIFFPYVIKLSLHLIGQIVRKKF